MREGPTRPSTCPITRNLCDTGCAWSLGGRCAVSVLAEGLTRYEPGAAEQDGLMAAASREHMRPCGTFRELTSKIFE